MALDLLRYNGSMPSYSFQQAMNPDPVHVDPYLRNFKFYGDPHFRLYDNGCGPDHNCTQSCQDPSVVFSSMYALHNCIMYPLVSSIVLAGNFSQSGLEVANHFGMTGHANITSEIKRVVNSCIDEYCSTKSGTEDPCSTSYDIPIGYSNGVFLFSLGSNGTERWRVKDICDGLPDNINPDIGGPGVFISYLLQSGIALVAWLMLRFFDTWTRNTTFWFLLPSDPWRAWQGAQGLQLIMRKSRQRDALLSALVDFQKAQCFFMLAVQAAALVAVKKSAGFEARSLQEYANNVDYLPIITKSGSIPVTFVLFTLHNAGMRSWYVFVLSLCTVVISAVTWSNIKAQTFTIEPLSGRQCGGNPWPVAFCYLSSDRFYPFDSLYSFDSFDDRRGYFGDDSEIIFACVTIGLLLVDILKVFRLIDESGRIFHVNGYTRLRSYMEKWNVWRNKGSFIQKASTATILMGIEGGFLYMFSNHLFNIIPQTGAGRTWSFGQIIAVTIWAPSIIEYIYFVFFGIEIASEYRIPKPYKVVKFDKDNSIPTHIRSNYPIGNALSEAGMDLALLRHQRPSSTPDKGVSTEHLRDPSAHEQPERFNDGHRIGPEILPRATV